MIWMEMKCDRCHSGFAAEDGGVHDVLFVARTGYGASQNKNNAGRFLIYDLCPGCRKKLSRFMKEGTARTSSSEKSAIFDY